MIISLRVNIVIRLICLLLGAYYCILIGIEWWWCTQDQGANSSFISYLLDKIVILFDRCLIIKPSGLWRFAMILNWQKKTVSIQIAPCTLQCALHTVSPHLAISTVSSANRVFSNSPLSHASLASLLKTLRASHMSTIMTNPKRYGDSGQPWLIPACWGWLRESTPPSLTLTQRFE